MINLIPTPDDNHADQLNNNNTTLDHNNDAYKDSMDNHADQLNPNNSLYQG